MDEIQDHNDDEWQECFTIIKTEPDKHVSSINFTCLANHIQQIVPASSSR